MSKLFSVKYHAAIDTYRAARANAFTTRTVVAAAQAKLAKVGAEYNAADADYRAAAAADNAAEAAVDEAFDLIAKIRYFEPQQEDKS